MSQEKDSMIVNFILNGKLVKDGQLEINEYVKALDGWKILLETGLKIALPFTDGILLKIEPSKKGKIE